MQKVRISEDWFFSLNGGRQQKVDLPHDFIVRMPRDPNSAGGARTGFFPNGSGEYIRYFDFPEQEHVILDVDGAYMCAEVRMNDHVLGIHPHGYTPWLVDLTEKIRFGRTNKLSVTVNSLQPSTRWYSGGGLYRDLFLWTGGAARIEPWDIFVTTPVVAEARSEIRIQAKIASDADCRATLTFTVLSPAGEPVCTKGSSIKLTADEKTLVDCTLPLENALLWDTDNPNLYTLRTKLLVDGKVTDTDERTFGIRSIKFDAEHGLRLNGKSIKLRGGCIHHDHGVLGAASFPAAEERKLSRLKAAGFNAIRTAHNPPSLALLEYCDRAGIIVMDEAFDMWRDFKAPLDYHLWFEDWWARDIAYMVLRDRNHPCVFSYSIGNEIHERDGSSDGPKWAHALADEVRKYDTTRPVTSALCLLWSRKSASDPEDYVTDRYGGYPEDQRFALIGGYWDKVTEDYFSALDICGYNYLHCRYGYDREHYPERIIWGSESKALEIYDIWEEVIKYDNVLGDFTWTAYDNLGEAGAGRGIWARDGYMDNISLAGYPWRSCYQGDLDLCGYRRPQSYYRETVWGLRDKPVMFTAHPDHYGEGYSGTTWHWYDVHDDWSFGAKYIGKPVEVTVYTDADAVEFVLNGRTKGRAIPVKMIATIGIPYEPGKLEAIAFKDGMETGRTELVTVGEAAKLAIRAEKQELTADGRDLCYLQIEVQDAEGRRLPVSKAAISCEVIDGELMGIFSGAPANEDEYGSPRCHAFEGRALAIIRAKNAGKISVRVHSEGLASAAAEVEAK